MTQAAQSLVMLTEQSQGAEQGRQKPQHSLKDFLIFSWTLPFFFSFFGRHPGGVNCVKCCFDCIK
ncbi:hypothetical protein GbCGDNIH2_7044 [Granulibacter bethesdensis]|nr:hypothetical protein GbCGDNIH2_7044 [Granulibacter bethesdensis]